MAPANWMGQQPHTFTPHVAAECANYGLRFEATSRQLPKLVFRCNNDVLQEGRDIRTLRSSASMTTRPTPARPIWRNLGARRQSRRPRQQASVHRPQLENLGHALRLSARRCRRSLVENLPAASHPLWNYHPTIDNHVYSQRHPQPLEHGAVQSAGMTISASRSLADGDGLTSTLPIRRHAAHPDQRPHPSGTAVTHMKNVKTVNWNDNSKAKAW